MITYLDTETTGNEPEEPIQIGLLSYDLQMPLQMCLKCKSVKASKPSAIVIHGISQQGDDYEAPDEIAYLVQEYIETNPDDWFIGYNVSFDINIINDFLARWKVITEPWKPKSIDVLRFARKILSINDLGDFKMSTVFYYLYPDRLNELFENRAKHDALTDCFICRDVYRALCSRAVLLEGGAFNPDDPCAVASFVETPIVVSTMPFGKHKGRPLADVVASDRDYLSWFLKQPREPQNADLVYSIERLLYSRKRP